MISISFEENRKIQTEILLEFASFCKKNNLTYYLAYGTLLGAVRHKGFIPWDDDIDVWMPRGDYKKFIDLYRKSKENSHYKLSIPGEKISKHSFLKMYDSNTVKIEDGVYYKNDYLGIDIDIWPLDGQPEDEQYYFKWYKKLKFQYLLFFASISSLKYGNLKRKLKVLLLKIIAGNRRKILDKTEKMHTTFPFNECKKIGCIISYFNVKKDRYLKSWFDKTILLDFEGHKLCAPAEYDKILTQRYGDYMQLPPEHQRVTHHKNNVFWKEN